MSSARLKPTGRFTHPCRFKCGRFIKIKRAPCYACILAALTGGEPGPATLKDEQAREREKRNAKRTIKSFLSTAESFAFCNSL